jgi:uncharacterized membrane protein YeiB
VGPVSAPGARAEGHPAHRATPASAGLADPPGAVAAGSGGRLDGLDLARGVAVVSMLIAHLGPVGGPLAITEYLTAPLFAVVIGVSMGISLVRRGGAQGWFVLDNLVRGLLLIALGLVLQALYGQIIVVLSYLGLLVIVLAPLALVLHRAPVLTLGLAVGGAVLSPVLMGRARDHLGASFGEVPTTLLTWTAAGQAYRLTSLLPMALGGLVLATVLPRAGEPPRGYAVAGILLGASLAIYLVGAASPDGSHAYSGTTAEILGATLLATGSVVAAFVVVALGRRWRLGAVLEPLLATGRLALTAYTLQVVLLAGLAVLRNNARDDGWLMLGGTSLVVVTVCWALDRWWGTGPLEWLFRWPGRALRTLTHSRPGPG